MIATIAGLAALSLAVSDTDDFLAACGAEAEAAGAPPIVCQCIVDEAGSDAVVAELLASMEEPDMNARMASLSDEAKTAVAACMPAPE